MRNPGILPPPVRREKLILRMIIILGLLGILYFYLWFLDTEFIQNRFLFWILVFSLTYDMIKTLYLWYHYWDISVPEKPASTRSFSVDVLTTFFPGEPYEMVKETLLAIKKIKYPHSTYLCDEANDPYLIEFCRENDIIHVTRNNRIDAKAGNINNALKQAKGELCLILDPDHVPYEDFLDEIVPYFEDEEVGYVQTVQAYYNINESSVARGGAEQTFHFYGPVMMSMNSYGTVNAIGANCLFRRKALDSIGGHAPGLSEDMHTAMQLHAKGWKSIYVPKIFTRGLTPASLTAFYKQQLKWSRGTFELLVSVYPRLFNKFTFRQKLHYGILPFHYFSGIIYLINFLIPVISLFSASTPWKGNMLDFTLMLAPVLICALGIRFYVQKWLINDSERGLHMMGGLLQISTWWINIIGFVYTLIRKKVPYLPTPKEDKEKTSWLILIPNMTIGIISLIAVVYGLSIDFTPFSFFMSLFAILNAGFMFSVLHFAFQKQTHVSFNSFASEETTFLDRLRNISFDFRRKATLPVIITVFILVVNIHSNINYKKWLGVKPANPVANTINYLGIFAPELNNGLSDLNRAEEISRQIDEKFNIIAIYMPWKNDGNRSFPQTLVDSIYLNKSIPLITWEPWINSFPDAANSGKSVYDLINERYFDNYILTFAEILKNLQRPVFMRFAHEFDNPLYPWCINGEENSKKFKRAWIHVHDLFSEAGAGNVVWIWNPWKTSNIKAYYPGSEYVDWAAADILNYSNLNPDKRDYSFEDLYTPFHKELMDLPALPVMITEFGTLKDSPSQARWLNEAFDAIEKRYPEIKSIIYFNSKVDYNFPVRNQNVQFLDWTLPPHHTPGNSFISRMMPSYIFDTIPAINLNNTIISKPEIPVLKNIRGVNLKKGHNWYKDYNVLNRETLLSDFDNMKKLTINTIKFESSSIYKFNLLNISKEFNLKVFYGFWIPENVDFVTDTLKARELKSDILEEISNRRQYSNIIVWYIQNDVIFNQRINFHKPELFFQNRAYVSWLKDLTNEIKKLDSRPIIVDLEVNYLTTENVKILLDNIPGIDCIGLVVKNDKYLNNVTEYLIKNNIGYIFSEINSETYLHNDNVGKNSSFFVTAWQDQHESDKVTFEGLLDRKGRFKEEYFMLKKSLLGSGPDIKSAEPRILKPAVFIYDNMKVKYTALLYYDDKGWQYGWNSGKMEFEWSLVRCDKYGNYLALKEVGRGPVLDLTIPEDQDLYRLLLTVNDGVTVNSVITRLNTPLKESSPENN